MKIISEEDILRTFPEKFRFYAKEYFKFKTGDSDLSVSKSEIQEWVKGRTPMPIKTIEDLKHRKLLPLLKNDHRLPIIARVVGAMFGDGSLNYSHKGQSNLKGDFYSKNIYDLNKFASDINNIFGSDMICKINQYSHKSKYGECKVYRLGKASICRFLACLGVPVGDKVTQILKIPDWILNGSRQSKIGFLDGLFSCEGHKPRKQKVSNLPFMIGLSMSKIQNLTKEHHEFLNSIKKMLNQIGIQTWPKILRGNMRKRKDGSITYEWIIYITNSRQNITNLYNTFNFTYAPDKKIALKKILLENHDIIFENEKAVYAPRTKFVLQSNSSGTTSVPHKVRSLLNLKVGDIYFITKNGENSVTVTKKSGELKRKLGKGYVFSLPESFVNHLKLSNFNVYIHWFQVNNNKFIMRSDKLKISPMLAKIGSVEDLKRRDLIFEPKLDGN